MFNRHEKASTAPIHINIPVFRKERTIKNEIYNGSQRDAFIVAPDYTDEQTVLKKETKKKSK